MNVDEMEAGREFDALVAEKVMGWQRQEIDNLPQWHHPWILPDGACTYALPDFSTDIAAAWRVVEKLGVERDSFCLEFGIGQWVCYFGSVYSLVGDAPLAICRAALKTVTKEGEDEKVSG